MSKNLKSILKPYFKNYIILSNFLGKYNDYIYDYRKRSRRYRVLSVQILDDFRKAIKKHIDNWLSKNNDIKMELNQLELILLSIVDKYENLHKPKPTPFSQIKKFHPNLNLDYFKVINTKEKAYWLGFLYADGYIGRRKINKKVLYRVGIALKKRDKKVIERFCKKIGGNPKFIKNEKIKSISGKYITLVRFRFVNNKFAKNLIRCGVFPGKGKALKLKLPNFVRNELTKKEIFRLYLAFLLGYYDGDGTLINNSQARIISSNRKFLGEIKKYFKFKTKIIHQEKEIYDVNRGVMFPSSVFVITIPKPIFKMMMLNYQRSLSRKRILIEDFGYKKRENKVQNWLKKVISKKTLENLIDILPLCHISKLLEINVSTLKKVLKSYNIKPQPTHYWSSKVLNQHHSIQTPKKWETFLRNLAREKDL
ncbi:MAG: LAGLIDADG family homing endonuclease [Candidatus Lokiarchaeota archaeon]